MALEVSINASLSDGLLPDESKPLPEQMLTYYQPGGIHSGIKVYLNP